MLHGFGVLSTSQLSASISVEEVGVGPNENGSARQFRQTVRL